MSTKLLLQSYYLGKELATILLKNINKNIKEIVVASTAEDLDSIGKGCLDQIEKVIDTRLICFWNGHITPFTNSNIECTPIIKKYHEKPNTKIQCLVMISNIVETDITIKTNLINLIQTNKPKEIYIVAPFMYTNIHKDLAASLPTDIKKRIYYYCFNYFKKDLKNQERKLHPEVIFIPNTITERRLKYTKGE